MLTVPSHFGFLRGTEIWWPEAAADVHALLDSAAVITVRQCGRRVAAELGGYAFRIRASPTVVTDLTASEEELWRRLDPKSCRYVIRKGRELGARISRNEEADEALALINAHRRRTQYSQELSPEYWARVLAYTDVFVASHEGVPLAAHVILVDPPRVRLLMSATADRVETGTARVAGALNRLLHWHELLHYKDRGFASYDFGGVNLDRSSPRYSISQFKLSFGGDLVDEFSLRLAHNALLRRVLQIASGVRLNVIALRQRYTIRGGAHVGGPLETRAISAAVDVDTEARLSDRREPLPAEAPPLRADRASFLRRSDSQER